MVGLTSLGVGAASKQPAAATVPASRGAAGEEKEASASAGPSAGESREEQARQRFEMFDTDRNGYLSPAELRRYLTSVVRAKCAADSAVRGAARGSTAEQIASDTTIQCFEEADTDKCEPSFRRLPPSPPRHGRPNHCDCPRDGKLSFDEFYRWVNRDSHGCSTASPAVPPAAPAAANEAVSEVRETGRLREVSFRDAMKALSTYASEDGCARPASRAWCPLAPLVRARCDRGCAFPSLPSPQHARPSRVRAGAEQPRSVAGERCAASSPRGAAGGAGVRAV